MLADRFGLQTSLTSGDYSRAWNEIVLSSYDAAEASDWLSASVLVTLKIMLCPLFLRATAGTAIARLSHRNSVCLSLRLSVTRVDQAKTVQARIIKSSPSAAPRTLASASVTLSKNSIGVTPIDGPK